MSRTTGRTLVTFTIVLLLVPPAVGLFVACGTSIAQETRRDYTSRVPRFTFAKGLPEQESQLKENLLVRRFRESRLKMVGDPHRPIYHFVSPEGQLNDPNGLCCWQGRWHLFYQARPPEDGRWHWAHAVSDDLIHWRDLPYAIYPNPEEQCYSGSTLTEEDRVIAMYHGRELGNMVAVSRDPLLLNWEKVGGDTVIPLRRNGKYYHFLSQEPLPYRVYDPCIWKKDGVYYSLSGSMQYSGPDGKPVLAEYLFRSKDLASWEFVHQFLENDRFTLVGDDGACPYFWPMALPTNQEIVLPAIRGNAMEIIAEIDARNAPMVELNVLRSPDKEEFTRIALFKSCSASSRFMTPQQRLSAVSLDGSRASQLPNVLSRPPETATVFVPPGEPFKLRLFVDRSVVEVFVNGRQCVAMRVYPGRADSLGVSLLSQGQDAELKSLTAWQMKSIYE